MTEAVHLDMEFVVHVSTSTRKYCDNTHKYCDNTHEY